MQINDINLDDLQTFSGLDPDGMLGHIDALPDQLEAAWDHAQTLPFSETFKTAQRIVITGMGGSAIGGDYLAALVADRSAVPIFVNREYDLPGFVTGPETLVVASSHSGNTEETLSAFAQAQERGAQLMVVATGGQLAAEAESANIPFWQFAYDSQPRAAFGWGFGLLIGLAHRLNLVNDLTAEVQEAVKVLQQGRGEFSAETPTHQNLAKRFAPQFCDRIGVMYGSGILAPVARRWKAQFNENAKNWAEYDILPEQNHNGVAGTEHPRQAIDKLGCVILQSSYDHPRVALRQELTYREWQNQGILVDKFKAQGKSRLAQMMNATQLGDYTSFYLAMVNGVDPTPIPQIVSFKEGLANAE